MSQHKPYIISSVVLVLIIIGLVAGMRYFAAPDYGARDYARVNQDHDPFDDDIFVPNRLRLVGTDQEKDQDQEETELSKDKVVSLLPKRGAEKKATEDDLKAMEVFERSNTPIISPMSYFSDDDLNKRFQSKTKTTSETEKQASIEPLFEELNKLREPVMVIDPVQEDPKNTKEQAPQQKRPQIIIVIDDLGVNQSMTRKLLDIKAPMTAAFLPYGKNLDKHVKKAKEQGYSIMLHMPMEPYGLDKNNPGPNALLVDNTPRVNQLNLLKAIEQFPNLIGLNNHMGSRFTSDQKAFEPIAEEIVQKGVFFLDSKTSQSSVAEDLIRQRGGTVYARDVFIDHYDDGPSVQKALRRIETLAKRRGHVIAIGHPKPETIRQLKKWIPTLHDKGFELITLDELHRRRSS